jgi:hypothetical protein
MLIVASPRQVRDINGLQPRQRYKRNSLAFSSYPVLDIPDILAGD